MQIYLLAIDEYWTQCEFRFEQLLQLLSLAGQLPIKSMVSYSDRCVSLGNQVLQMYVLHQVTGINPRKVLGKLKFGPSGKPMIDGVYFNLSNDKETSVNSMVVSMESPVGIDLINWRLVTEEFVAEMTPVCHASEARMLVCLNPCRMFAQLWSLKESYVKYLGVGITRIKLDLLEFRQVRLLTESGDINEDIELYIDGAKVGVAVVMRLWRSDVYVTVISGTSQRSQLIELDLKHVCQVCSRN